MFKYLLSFCIAAVLIYVVLKVHRFFESKNNEFSGRKTDTLFFTAIFLIAILSVVVIYSAINLLLYVFVF